MVAHVRYSVTGRSRSRVALCAVCTVHVKTRSMCFLVEPQNQGQRFVSGLASKPLGRFIGGLASTTGMVFFGLVSKLMVIVFSGLVSKPMVTVFSGLASKPVAQVSRFGPQNRQLQFGDLGIKIIVTIFLFGLKKQAGFGLSIVRHAPRSDGLLHLEASRAKVS
jgi:hypothetical protein